MLQRKRCPVHKEDTPSFVIYSDGHAHCYGCGYSTQMTPSLVTPEPLYKEDLSQILSYIDSLPVCPFRGLALPRDGKYAYIVWPNRDYYKKRCLYPVDGYPKYKGAAGHTKPLFVINPARKSPKLTIIVEGELNALSLAEVVTDDVQIICPGGATDLHSVKSIQEMNKLITKQEPILIIADNDTAGSKGAILCKLELIYNYSTITIDLWEQDANSILEGNGRTGLEERLQKLGVAVHSQLPCYF